MEISKDADKIKQDREQVVELISQLSERGKELLDQRAGRSAPLAPEERG